MRISDWSSDVCSSDLEVPHLTTGLYPLKLRQCLVFTIQIRLLIVHEALSTCGHYPPTSRAPSLISTPASAFDTGHPSLAVSARVLKAARSIPGPSPAVTRAMLGIEKIGRASGGKDGVTTCRFSWSP